MAAISQFHGRLAAGFPASLSAHKGIDDQRLGSQKQYAVGHVEPAHSVTVESLEPGHARSVILAPPGEYWP
jgi:hypothetical protein